MLEPTHLQTLERANVNACVFVCASMRVKTSLLSVKHNPVSRPAHTLPSRGLPRAGVSQSA